MALYGNSNFLKSNNNSDEAMLEGVDLKPYVQMIAYDDISRGTDTQVKEFCVSEVAEILCEKQVLNKNTMMRLSKADDEKRRIKLVAYQLAKEANDPLWKKMTHYRSEWKKYRDQIMDKYGRKAAAIAKAAQKEYIKNAKKA